MRWAFTKLAEGCFNVEQIYKQATEKGLKCTKSNFWKCVRNPVYCGKIAIPKYKEEEACTVKAQHEPLISESVFNEVQGVLDGRKRYYRPKFVAHSVLPLRGFLICPIRGKILTGSKSKGRNQDYFYCHCGRPCKARFRAEQTNNLFVRELKKFAPRPEYLEIYKRCIIEAWHDQTKHARDPVRIIRRCTPRDPVHIGLTQSLCIAFGAAHTFFVCPRCKQARALPNKKSRPGCRQVSFVTPDIQFSHHFLKDLKRLASITA